MYNTSTINIYQMNKECNILNGLIITNVRFFYGLHATKLGVAWTNIEIWIVKPLNFGRTILAKAKM